MLEEIGRDKFQIKISRKTLTFKRKIDLVAVNKIPKECIKVTESSKMENLKEVLPPEKVPTSKEMVLIQLR